jgi:hypothetical protein
VPEDAEAVEMELLAALACDRFGKLPSEVGEEDFDAVARTLAILGEVDRVRAGAKSRRPGKRSR